MKVYYKQVQLNPTTASEYPDLLDKPFINGVELNGDQDTEQIKVTWFGTQAEFDALGTYSPTTFYIIDDGAPVGEQQDYLDLANKPSINGQVLTGNKLSSDLSMYTSEQIDNMLASLRSIKVVDTLPSAPLANTMYYVGPDSEGVYMVYLFDSLLNRINLGPSVQKLYDPGRAIQINAATNVIDVKMDNDTIITNASNEIYVPDATNTQKGVVKYDNDTIKKNASDQIYVPDATNTQKGVIIYDNISINKNSSSQLQGNIDTIYPVGTEIKVYNTSFNPNNADWYKTGTWVNDTTAGIETTFMFTNSDFTASSGYINRITNAGNNVSFYYDVKGQLLKLSGATRVIPTMKVICSQDYSTSIDSLHGLSGVEIGSTAYVVSQGHRYEQGTGDTWPTKNENFTSSSQNINFCSFASHMPKNYNVWEYTVQRFPVGGNGVAINGISQSGSSGNGANYTFSASVVAQNDTAMPMIYQSSSSNSTFSDVKWLITLYEKGDTNTLYKVWRRTA